MHVNQWMQRREMCKMKYLQYKGDNEFRKDAK